MSITTANPPVRSSPTAENGRGASDEYIEAQIAKTRRDVKIVDLLSALMVLAGGIIGFVLVVAIIDHWMFALAPWLRWTLLGGLALSSVGYVLLVILPLVLGSINPLYAARAIEHNEPSLRNSVINYLMFRQDRAGLRTGIYEALKLRAAVDLSHAHLESAVDRTRLIRIGYVLIAILVAFAAYTILSPKSPFQTMRRVAAPWADIVRPSRVRIEDVQPGSREVFYGDSISVTADLYDLREAEPVHLIYSSLDGRISEQVIEMLPSEAGLNYRAQLPPDNAGIQQDLVYRIEAGDAQTASYHLTVMPAPTILVQQIEYEYPAYTQQPKRVAERQGDIKALEGTRVTIRAQANKPIAWASIALDPNSITRSSATDDDPASAGSLAAPAADSITMQFEGQQAWGSFVLMMEETGARPKHSTYQLQFGTDDGKSNPQAPIHRIEVTQDLSPEIEILTPTEDRIELPEDRVLPIEVRAIDPDYGLRSIQIRATAGGVDLLSETVLDDADGRIGQVITSYDFKPWEYKLKSGDAFVFWAITEDNRVSPRTGQLEPNIARTRTFHVTVVDGVDKPAAPQPTPADVPEDNPAPQPPNPSDEMDTGATDETTSSDEPAGSEENQGNEGDDNPQGDPSQTQDPNGGGSSPEGGGGTGEEGSSASEAGGGQSGTGSSASPDSASESGGESGGSGGSSTDTSGSPESGGSESSGGGSDGSTGEDSSGGGGESSSASNNGNATNGSASSASKTAASTNQKATGDEPLHEGEVIERTMEYMQSQNADGASSDEAGNQGSSNSDSTTGGAESESSEDNSGASGTEGQDPKQGSAGEQSSGGTPTGGTPKPSDDPAGSGAQGANPEQGGTPKAGGGGEQKEDANQGAGPKKDGTSGGESGSPQGPMGTKKEKENSGSSSPSGQPKQGGSSDNGQSGGGESSKEESGSASSEQQNEDSQKQSGGGEDSKPSGGSQQSPGQSKKQSSSGSDSQGDQSGGGKQGGGQGGGQEGNDSGGSNSVADQGSGTAQESGAGETVERPGSSQTAESETGNPGTQKGMGSSAQPTPGGTGQGSKADSPTDPDGSKRPAGQPTPGSTDDRGQGLPIGGGRPSAADLQGFDMTGEVPPGEKPNLEYSRRTTNMVLEYLRDQEQKPDAELLEQLGWTEDDLRNFLQRWETLDRQAKQTPDGQQQLDEALRSLGLRANQSSTRRTSVEVDSLQGVQDTGVRSNPPSRYLEQYNAYRKGTGRVNE